MLKKWSYTLLVVMLAMSLVLGACSSDNAGDGKADGKEGKDDSKISGEITVWTHPFVGTDLRQKEADFRDDLKKSFEKKYPDVKVTIEEIPWPNREERLLTALAANEGPDVFYIIPDMLTQFAHKGVLEPLDDYLDGYDKDDFNESALLAATFEDKVYALPVLQGVMGMYYNTDLVKEVGGDPEKLPTNWDEYLELAEKAKKKDKFIGVFEGGNAPNMAVYPYIWQAGGRVIDDEGKVRVDEAESVAAYEHINTLYEKGFVPKDSVSAPSQFEIFRAGKSLSYFGDSQLVATLRAEEPDFAWGVGPMLESKEKVSYGTTGMYTVPSNSKNKAAAAEFVKFMASKENIETFNEITQYIPPRQSAAKIFDGDDILKELVEQAKDTRPGVIHPIGREIGQNMTASIQAMLSGELKPKEAAEKAATEIKAVMEREGFK